MRTVAHLLEAKPDRVLHAIAPEATMLEAAALMAAMQIGALVVVEEGRIAGLLTERDFVFHAAGAARGDARPSLAHARVRDVMTSPAACVDLGTSLEQCMILMTNRRTRHLPVLAGESLRGLVSIGDLVKHTMDEQRFTIQQLESYICS